ncbi:MAG: hypothetical protein V3U75_03635 [Methylococcaceae bacterium]
MIPIPFVNFLIHIQIKIIATIIFILVLAGCSQNEKDQSVIDEQIVKSPPKKLFQQDKGWWYARFRIHWPKKSKPRWHMGEMIAVEIINPILLAHRADIDWWRFHRRAARDGHDHVFSFIFYSTPSIAEQIYSEIKQDAELKQLQEEQQIIWLGFDNPAKIGRPDLEDTSDKHWPIVIQKSWPKYIMGVSEMWLDVILQLTTEFEGQEQGEAKYRKIHHQFTELWKANGQHAWLHHLNALHAYQPFNVRY